jgi:hypothetical protein
VLSRITGTIYRGTERISSNALLNLLEVGPDPVTRQKVAKRLRASMRRLTPVSIAQRLWNEKSPWGRKWPITIIGYSIIHEVRGETGQPTWMLVGSASGGAGADVFAMTAGRGNSSSSLMFPPGIGLPHDGKHPDAHIDVYGSCPGGGEQRGLVAIFYTSP